MELKMTGWGGVCWQVASSRPHGKGVGEIMLEDQTSGLGNLTEKNHPLWLRGAPCTAPSVKGLMIAMESLVEALSNEGSSYHSQEH